MTTRCQALQEAENMRHPHSGDLVEQLRHRACSVEEQPESDHGHSDCYLEREAANEIELLRSKLALLESRKGVRWDGPA